MVSFSMVAIGGSSRSLLRRKVTPSAMHPGGKYVPRNAFTSTVLENFSCSALTTTSRVNGQRLSSNTAAPPITTSANTMPILIERDDTLDLFFKTSLFNSSKTDRNLQLGTLNGLCE